jgi:anaerobic glycerol-3-phosphate dehydrogenase
MINMYNGGMAAGWSENQQEQKQTHPEWGVMKEQDFHPLTLKHQRDLENLHQAGKIITDFYFWQANLGGYCLANMVQSKYITLYSI